MSNPNALNNKEELPPLEVDERTENQKESQNRGGRRGDWWYIAMMDLMNVNKSIRGGTHDHWGGLHNWQCNNGPLLLRIGFLTHKKD